MEGTESEPREREQETGGMVQDTPQGQRGISGQGGEGAGTAVATSDIGDEGEIGQAAVPAYEDAGTRDDPDTGE